jgi:hypothetical protein
LVCDKKEKEVIKTDRYSIEEIWNFPKKYRMSILDTIILRRTIVTSLVAVKKCCELGLEKEIFKETIEEIHRLEKESEDDTK